MGMDGWRVVFYTVAAVSAAIGVLTVVGGRDPLYLPSGRRERRLDGSLSALRGEVWQLLTAPTFCVLIAQVISLWSNSAVTPYVANSCTLDNWNA